MSLRSKASKTIRVGDNRAEVKSEKYNPLIERLEVELEIHHELKPTPSRIEVRKALAEAYGVGVERVYVRSLITEYGVGVTKAVVHIYDSPERALKFEPEYIIKRNGGLNLEG